MNKHRWSCSELYQGGTLESFGIRGLINLGSVTATKHLSVQGIIQMRGNFPTCTSLWELTLSYVHKQAVEEVPSPCDWRVVLPLWAGLSSSHCNGEKKLFQILHCKLSNSAPKESSCFSCPSLCARRTVCLDSEISIKDKMFFHGCCLALYVCRYTGI